MPRVASHWMRLGFVFASFLLLAVPSGPELGAAEALIPIGAEWSFFRGTSAPSEPMTEWRQPDFDDASWELGPTGIGYGDDDDASTLDDMQNSYVALFARKAFDLVDPSRLSSLALLIDFDDGFVAYLNGVEVARSNIAPGAEDSFDQTAAAAREASGGGGPPAERIDLTAGLSLLQAGRNVLAIEARNVAVASTDLSLIPELLGDDEALKCPTGLTCAAEPGNQVSLAWTNHSPLYDRIEITRNGAPIAGSPFAGDAASAVDPSPGTTLDAVYRLVAISDGAPCAEITCTSTVTARGLSTLQCSLALEGGVTQGELSWVNIAGTVRAEVRREGVLIATLTNGETSYLDLDVESDMAEDDTAYEVKLFDGSGNAATMGCPGGDLSLCPSLTCGQVNVGGIDRVRLAIGNPVKEWTTFTVERQLPGEAAPTVLTDTLPGTAAEFVDETYAPQAGESATYFLRPVAPGMQVACDQTCSFTPPVPEDADYNVPNLGWDYLIDFEAHPATPMTRYNAVAGEPGNLDGGWIRAIGRDFWDGSAPAEVGPAPDGPAPGGVEVVTLPGLGPCGSDVKALRLLDPGDPSAPAGSLAVEFPDPFDDPSNKAIFLGLDTGVKEINLLHTGVTFAARWRIDPNSPSYLAATPGGDGQPLAGGGSLGNVGFYFLNAGLVMPGEGPSASVAFALDSNDFLRFSAAGGALSLGAASNTTFRSLWVTVEDPEGDATHDVTVYTNGQTTPFRFVTGQGLQLAEPPLDFGSTAGNFLALGLPDIGNDGVIQIDYLAYKAGVHAPSAAPCTPCANNRPTARIAVTPAAAQVTLAGGKAQVTLSGQTSDSGDGPGQPLGFVWGKVSGPAGDAIAAPAAGSTAVDFTTAGTYVYRLTVDDGQTCNRTAIAQATITVLPEAGGSKSFRRGDADGDGRAEITDAVITLGFLFQGTGNPGCLDAADADDSGLIDITDAVRLLGYLFLGDPPLPAPTADACGPDPTTGDPYDCRVSACP